MRIAEPDYCPVTQTLFERARALQIKIRTSLYEIAGVACVAVE
jgi:hypothetical protein